MSRLLCQLSYAAVACARSLYKKGPACVNGISSAHSETAPRLVPGTCLASWRVAFGYKGQAIQRQVGYKGQSREAVKHQPAKFVARAYERGVLAQL